MGFSSSEYITNIVNPDVKIYFLDITGICKNLTDAYKLSLKKSKKEGNGYKLNLCI